MSLSNPSQASRMAAAIEQEQSNRDRELDEKVAAIYRTAPGRDANPGARQVYDMAYNAMERLAQSRADSTGRTVVIPVRNPPVSLPVEVRQWASAVVAALAKANITVPPLPAPALEERIEPRSGTGRYHETGSGKKATGIMPTRPDGSPNEAWLNLQGVKS